MSETPGEQIFDYDTDGREDDESVDIDQVLGSDNTDEQAIYNPPEKPLGLDKFGTTLEEMGEGESLDQRLSEEVPDPNLAFDDPLAEDESSGAELIDGERVEDGDLDDSEVGDERAGRLVDPDEGAREDAEKDLVGSDVGIDGAAASAEEAAVHIIADDAGEGLLDD